MTTLLRRAPDPTDEELPGAGSAPDPGPVPPAQVPVPRGTPEHRLVMDGVLTRDDAEWLEPQLDALVATGHRTVEVELSQVQSMDAAVARVLLRSSWHLGDPDRALLLLHPRPQVHRVLRFVGAGGLVVR